MAVQTESRCVGVNTATTRSLTGDGHRTRLLRQWFPPAHVRIAGPASGFLGQQVLLGLKNTPLQRVPG